MADTFSNHDNDWKAFVTRKPILPVPILPKEYCQFMRFPEGLCSLDI